MPLIVFWLLSEKKFSQLNVKSRYHCLKTSCWLSKLIIREKYIAKTMLRENNFEKKMDTFCKMFLSKLTCFLMLLHIYVAMRPRFLVIICILFAHVHDNSWMNVLSNDLLWKNFSWYVSIFCVKIVWYSIRETCGRVDI